MLKFRTPESNKSVIGEWSMCRYSRLRSSDPDIARIDRSIHESNQIRSHALRLVEIDKASLASDVATTSMLTSYIRGSQTTLYTVTVKDKALRHEMKTL
ncbi:hypothetical protein EVAR_67437_1 [Eumeta japonica]|uniref:Uncharacterized protein n=1 Tax=Eumeta variegata TaxID=151549 RepID=A0A4C1ZVT6_EUMVA|nr:hypothetical protein EVAR_67437_1 [Eumeta japonica]